MNEDKRGPDYAGDDAARNGDTIITIDMNKKCAECGKPGACGSGICMRCATRAINPASQMRSPQGRAVQERYKQLLREARREI